MPDRDLPEFDPYAVLGVPVTASRTEIEAAFRAAAMREHPDVSPDPAAATARMQRLNVARDWLTDAQRRSRYDAARGVRPVGGVVADLPDFDPLGPWPADPVLERRGPQVGPVMASIALMVIITLVFVGSNSLLAAAIGGAAVVVLLFGALLTILGAGR